MRASWLAVLCIIVSWAPPLITRGWAKPAARAALERRLQQQPTDDTIRYRLALQLAREGLVDSAIEHFQQLVTRHPTKGKLRRALALLYRKRGRLGRAVAVLATGTVAEQRLPAEQSLLERLRRELHEQAAPLARRALAYYDKDAPLQAYRLTQELLELDPRDETGLLLSAMLADDRNEQGEAIRLYRKLLAAYPQNGRGAARLALLLVSSNKLDEARSLVNVAAATAGTLIATRTVQAELMAADNRYVDAITMLQAALARGPNETTALKLLVRMFNFHMRLKDYGAAEEALARIRRIDDTLSALPFMTGRLERGRGNYDKAIEAMQTYVAGPQPPSMMTVWALSTISSIHERHGRYRAAVETINRALRLAPHDMPLIAQKSTVREKWRLQSLGTATVRGAFVYHHLKGLSPTVLDRVDRLFRRAYNRVSTAYGVQPTGIVVKILAATASAMPAFYDTMTDEICVAREQFDGSAPTTKPAVAEHITIHEMSHCLLRRAAGQAVFLLPNLWMVEGLAEYHAGELERSGHRVASVMHHGLFDYARLGNYLAIDGLGAGEKRLKAYLQANLMVTVLHRQFPDDACRRIVAAMQAIARNEALGTVYQRHFSLTPAALLERTKALIEAEYVKAQPR